MRWNFQVRAGWSAGFPPSPGAALRQRTTCSRSKEAGSCLPSAEDKDHEQGCERCGTRVQLTKGTSPILAGPSRNNGRLAVSGLLPHGATDPPLPQCSGPHTDTAGHGFLQTACMSASSNASCAYVARRTNRPRISVPRSGSWSTRFAVGVPGTPLIHLE